MKFDGEKKTCRRYKKEMEAMVCVLVCVLCVYACVYVRVCVYERERTGVARRIGKKNAKLQC